MFKYAKRLQYPINIKKKDINMAKQLITQYGGSNGELAAPPPPLGILIKDILCLIKKDKHC